MPALACVVLLAALLSAQASRQEQDSPRVRGDTWQKPKWYHGMDGPEFEVIQTKDQNDLRRYEASKWVTTNITGAKFDDAYSAGTKALDDYFKGNNQPGGKIDSTVPTVVLIYPTGTDRSVQTTFTIEYFLPHELHAAPPAPKAPELGILDVQPNDVWIRVFGGYVSEQEVFDQAFGFLDQLKQEGISVDDTVLAVAFYDPITRLVGRHNEIWIWAKPAPSAASAAWSWLKRATQPIWKRSRP